MRLAFLVPLLAAGLIGHLASSSATAPSPPTAGTLVGSWHLVAQRVMVVDGHKLPDETLIFGEDQRFRFLRKKRLVAQGAYHTGRDSTCGQQGLAQLILEPASPGAYAPSGAYTLHGDTLVIDMTNTCASDMPIFTYRRAP
ncbi:MAG: hypothetical protein EOO62_34795 [Hymenobacter sp.]|nr:MAG: hypothetical protein EOO62_34795 [Hymenobacter sp.]